MNELEQMKTDQVKPGLITGCSKISGNIFQFDSDNGIFLQISILAQSIIRFRYALNGNFQKDFSYAVDATFKSEITEVFFNESDTFYEIKTSVLRCVVSKEGMKVRIEDEFESVISEEEEGFSGRKNLSQDGFAQSSISKYASRYETFFGLGGKATSLKLRGKSFENWISNEPSDSDISNISCPFYYGLNEGKAYGIFLNNSYRSHFDFDSKKNDSVTFSVEGGEMDYYFMFGPELYSVIKQYLELTGRPVLPPLWALGFQYSQIGFESEKQVLQMAKEFRQRNIPCDSFFINDYNFDIKKSFSWESKKFQNPTSMVRNLRERGFKTIVNVPGNLKVNELDKVFQLAKDKDFLCKNTQGKMVIDKASPSDIVFPDFTNLWVRKWWGHLFAELYSKNRVTGFANSLDLKIFPEDTQHDCDGQKVNHAKVHNVYEMQLSRATFEGLLNLKEHRRPFVLASSSHSGGQRYTSVFKKVQTASWEQLKIANRYCQQLSISGFSFAGVSIPSTSKTSNEELFIRWLQLSVFQPLFGVHSLNSQIEENSFLTGEHEKYVKYTIELRYQLLPYIYTAFWRYIKEHIPILSPLSFFDQNDKNCLQAENDFIFGDQILVSPIVAEKQSIQETYLPKGNWYYYWSGERFEGGQSVKVNAPLNRIPFFIRAGSVFPHYPIRQYTDEHPIDELNLHVYFKHGIEISQLYEDTGDGFEYQKSGFSLKTFEFRGTEEEVVLEQYKKGSHKDSYQHCNIIFYGLPFQPISCKSDDQKLSFEKLEIEGNVVFSLTLSNEFHCIRLKS